MSKQQRQTYHEQDLPGLWHGFMVILKRDLTLAYRRRAEITNPLVFFVIVVTLFPLSIGPEVNLLARVAPGIIWVAALLASLLALDAIFQPDHQDGTLEQIILSPHPLSLMVLAKVIAHWLVSGVPLMLLAPVLALLLNLPEQAIGVALTVGLRKGGVLLSLLVLPLYIPVLIFGALAVDSAAGGLSPAANLYLLGAVLALSLSLAPLAAAAALRVSLE